MKLPFGSEEEAAPPQPTSLMTGVLSADETNSQEGDLPNNGDQITPNSSFDLMRYSYKPGSEDQTPRKIDFLKDDPSEMTRSRRIALKLMEKPWYYNPNQKDPDEDGISTEGEQDHPDTSIEERGDRVIDDFDKDIAFKKPCLKSGWAYFEHQALYRFQLDKDYRTKEQHHFLKRIFRTLFMHKDKKFVRAEPGEDEFATRLYPFFTPHNQLGDFGLGIGLYFTALRIMIYLMLMCGLISMGNIIYFGGTDYDSTKSGVTWYNFFHKGTAQCKDMSWVPCPECHCEDISRPGRGIFPGQRCGISNITEITGAGNTTGNTIIQNLTFVLKNNCEGSLNLAAFNFATVVFLLLSIVALGFYMRRQEVIFDEDEQTAQDYSVQITNPPRDAHDPEEWRTYFRKNFDGAQVIVCTCAVENDLLVKSLVKRRELIREIHSMRPGKSLDAVELARAAAQIERDRGFKAHLKAKILPGMPELYSQLVSLVSKVQGLSQLEYPVTNVFLTFNTEEDQRNVLQKLSKARTNASGTAHSRLSFRGTYVLNAVEPEEPSTIRWQDLNAKFGTRLKLQVYTLLVTLVMLAIDSVIIFQVNQWKVVFGSYV